MLVTDNCPGDVHVTYSESLIAPGNCLNDRTVATVKLNWYGSDPCGNSTTLSLIGIVKDHTPPALVDYEPIINVGCTEAIRDMVGKDNCGSTTTITNQDVIIPGPCQYKYNIKRTITATDECGNSATFPQLIHVGDDNGPQIRGIVEKVCDDLTMPLVTAFDSCAGVQVGVTMVQDTLHDACRDGLVITRVWTAIDLCGDTTSITQFIIMGDTVAPEIIIPDNSIIQQLMSDDTIPVVYLSQDGMMHGLNNLDAFSVLVYDDCDLEIDPLFLAVITPSQNPQQDGFMEERQYFWIATDACGNADTLQFTVHIVDDIPPVAELPGDTAVYCSPLPPPMNMLPQDTSENVNVQYTQTIAAGQHEGEFNVIRTWIITDMSGNVSTVVQHIFWIPDTFVACEIIPPGEVECNSHDVQIGSNVTGGVGPFTYLWVVIGEECFIQAGQSTPEISIYVGWAPVTVILYVTDVYGCTTTCETTISCHATGFASAPASGSVTAQNDAIVNVWPNPSKGSLDLRFNLNQKQQCTVSLINFLGQTVLQTNLESEKGINEIHLDLSRIPDGPYFMDFQSQDIHSFRKIMLLKDK